MSAFEDRQRRRRDDEVALAHRFASIPAGPKPFGDWTVAAPPEIGIAWTCRPVGDDLRMTLVRVTGAGDIGRVLASRYCLEFLESRAEPDLAALNRHLLHAPPGDEWLIAAGCLTLSPSNWFGSFAGIARPRFGDGADGVGTGPFLGLAEATFPTDSGAWDADEPIRWMLAHGDESNWTMEIRRKSNAAGG